MIKFMDGKLNFILKKCGFPEYHRDIYERPLKQNRQGQLTKLHGTVKSKMHQTKELQTEPPQNGQQIRCNIVNVVTVGFPFDVMDVIRFLNVKYSGLRVLKSPALLPMFKTDSIEFRGHTLPKRPSDKGRQISRTTMSIK